MDYTDMETGKTVPVRKLAVRSDGTVEASVDGKIVRFAGDKEFSARYRRPVAVNGHPVKAVYVSREAGVVAIAFADVPSVSAKCRGGDEFDLRVGIALCLAKACARDAGTTFDRMVASMPVVEPKPKKPKKTKDVNLYKYRHKNVPFPEEAE